MDSPVRAAAVEDTSEVADILAAAFHDDPVMAWGFPDASTRPARLAVMFGFLGRHFYVPTGQCQIAQDAASLWRPPTLPTFMAPADEVWTEHGEEFALGLGKDLARLGVLGALMDAHHPTDPHRYLLALGVRPGGQGRGLGSALLALALADADTAGDACYLEATSPRSRVLYERFGFVVTDELRVDDSPPLWAMWRPPAH